MQDYWQRQTVDKPLFPDLLWSRPENRAHAGKLLVVGGNQHGFVAPADAYKAAEQAGAGTVRMLLPNSLQRYVGKTFTSGELAASTPSGSFAQKALGLLLDMAAWGDATLLAGDFGRNSETAILLEKFTSKYSGQLTIAQDAADYYISTPSSLLSRPDTLLVLGFAQAQKFFVSSHFPQALTSDMDFIRLVEAMHNFTTEHQVRLIITHEDKVLVAVDGQVSSTHITSDTASEVSIVNLAAAAAVWQLQSSGQNSGRAYQAITTAVAELIKKL